MSTTFIHINLFKKIIYFKLHIFKYIVLLFKSLLKSNRSSLLHIYFLIFVYLYFIIIGFFYNTMYSIYLKPLL